jgi:hypothetical protein
MIVETEEKDVRHPEGKILLKNGTILDCYPKENQPKAVVPDTVSLDMSGEFMQVKGGPKKRLRKPSLEPWKDLFFKEAFFLYEHKEQILADSRMFLTPLPFENNLAYTGTSGLRNATLGVYLEWWEECERAVIKKDGKVHALTYFIAGSPLSGSNHCAAVDKKGRRRTIQFKSPFSELWSSFMRINQRYTEAKQIYQAYTLEETLLKLREA